MVYTIFNLLLTAIFFAVIIYYKYYGVIATYKALEQVNQVTAVSNSVFSLIDPQYLLIFTDIIVFGILLIRSKAAADWKQAILRPVNKKLIASLFCVSLIVSSLHIYINRGGFNEVVKAENMGIFNYEAYTLLDQEEPELVPVSSITQERINELKRNRPDLCTFWFRRHCQGQERHYHSAGIVSEFPHQSQYRRYGNYAQPE